MDNTEILDENELISNHKQIIVLKRLHYFLAAIFFLFGSIIFIDKNNLFGPNLSFMLSLLFLMSGVGLFLYEFLRIHPIHIQYTDDIENQSHRLRVIIFNLNGAENIIHILNSKKNFNSDEFSILKKQIVRAFYYLRLSRFTKNLIDDRDIEKLCDTEIGRSVITKNIEQLRNYLLEKLSLLSSTTIEQDERSIRDKALLLSEKMQKRILKEIEQLSLRANVYIIIGTIITLLAGIYLYFLTNEVTKIINELPSVNKYNIWNTKEILSIFIRFSIVIFVEIFAFYYLKQYREIMNNIKYYQNEITNTELKTLGLLAVYSTQDNKSMNVIIEELSKTERNFILKKGETTVDLERQKNQQSTFNDALGKIVSIIRKEK